VLGILNSLVANVAGVDIGTVFGTITAILDTVNNVVSVTIDLTSPIAIDDTNSGALCELIVTDFFETLQVLDPFRISPCTTSSFKLISGTSYEYTANVTEASGERSIASLLFISLLLFVALI